MICIRQLSICVGVALAGSLLRKWGECVQEAAAANQMKCEAVCALGRLVAFCSLAAANWLTPQLVSHMVSHGKEVCHITPTTTQGSPFLLDVTVVRSSVHILLLAQAACRCLHQQLCGVLGSDFSEASSWSPC